MPGDHRRARLPRALHAEPGVVLGAAEDGRAVTSGRVRERRALARLGQVDAALLQRTPGMVP